MYSSSYLVDNSWTGHPIFPGNQKLAESGLTFVELGVVRGQLGREGRGREAALGCEPSVNNMVMGQSHKCT